MLFPEAYYLFLCPEILVVEKSEKKPEVAGWFVEKKMIDGAMKPFVVETSLQKFEKTDFVDKNVEYDQIGHT